MILCVCVYLCVLGEERKWSGLTDICDNVAPAEEYREVCDKQERHTFNLHW